MGFVRERESIGLAKTIACQLIFFFANSTHTHQGGIKFKLELRVHNQDYGGMKVEHFVVEKR